uniref:Coatomer subunit zeta n=1 Tax=Theileria annulata TaxID=5874 RepID=A0A3B0MW23_THEAN
MTNFNVTQVEAILILGENGEKIAVRYYKLHPSSKLSFSEDEQKIFEKSLVDQLEQARTSEIQHDCLLLENHLVVFSIVADVYIVVVGHLTENELILSQLCKNVEKVLEYLTKYVDIYVISFYDIKKDFVYEKLASVFLLLDDVVDGGIIMETEHEVIIKRLKRKENDSSDHVPVKQAIHNVRNNFTKFQTRNFGTKRVTQRRRFMLRIIRPEEKFTDKTMTNGLFDKNDCLPKSLLKSPVIRKLIYANTAESMKIASTINWDAYKCDVKGVRWHPSGSWLVQFSKRNYENNFFVNCKAYFRVEKHGFFEAKKLAIAYRKRLEFEYSQLEKTWEIMEKKREMEKMEKIKAKEIKELEEQFFLSDNLNSFET